MYCARRIPTPLPPPRGPPPLARCPTPVIPPTASLVCTVKIGAVDIYFPLDGQTWTLPVEQALSPDLA